MENIIKETICKIGIKLNDEQIEKLNLYYELLIEKNKVINLTTITEYDDVVIKHFADSIAIIKAIDLNKITNIIDVGTGAGFPGIVLKIVFPKINIVLLDSLNKRINFLNEVIEKLELKEIKCIHGRAEDFAHNNEYRENFDLCVSRAVANLSTLSEYCIPYVKINGYFISYKSEDCSKEVIESKIAISKLGGIIENNLEYRLPDTDITRRFIVVKKINSTKKLYPRKAGLPSKEPINK